MTAGTVGLVVPRGVTAVEICFDVADRHDGVLFGRATAPIWVSSGPMHQAHATWGGRGAGGEGAEDFAVGVEVDGARGPIEAVFVVVCGRVEGEFEDVEVGFSGAVVHHEVEGVVVVIWADLRGEELHIDFGCVCVVLSKGKFLVRPGNIWGRILANLRRRMHRMCH